MPLHENGFFYAMVARDALVVQPDKIRNVADATRWPPPTQGPARAAIGANANRSQRAMVESLHPTLETALLDPMSRSVNEADHKFDIETRQGNLPQRVVEAYNACHDILKQFMTGSMGWQPAMQAMGVLAHRLIDIHNPLHLSEAPPVVALREWFMNDVAVHVIELPFVWKFLDRDDDEIFQARPWETVDTTIISASRLREATLKPITDGYIGGNGFAAAKPHIEGWYNILVNEVAAAWRSCCI